MRSFIFALALTAAEAQYSLSDCTNFANLFDNTCTSGSTFSGSRGGWAAEVLTCSISGSLQSGQPTTFRKVGDGTQSTSANHRQKMCVSCRDDGGTIKIKVQSNTYPSHCYGTSNIPNYP